MWYILKEIPEFSPMNDTIYLECWFLEYNVILKVDCLKFTALSKDKFECIVFMSHLELNLENLEYFNKNKN